MQILSDEKAADIISKYIRGYKNPLYAHIIYEEYIGNRWRDWDNFNHKDYAISEKIKEELINSKATSAEEVLSIISSDQLEDI